MALEFFLGSLRTNGMTKPITSLICTSLGDVAQQPHGQITCMSVIETAAEKWVALTRRIATIRYRQHYMDNSLVRHLYDLYMINTQQGLEKDQFIALIKTIIDNDREHFKHHNDAYHENPITEIEYALSELKSNQQ